MNHLHELVEDLKAEAKTAEYRGRTEYAATLQSIVEDLEEAVLDDWAELFDQVLPIGEAAERAGYDRSTFNRHELPREPLPNGRGEGVRVRDCGVKPGRMMVLLGLEAVPGKQSSKGSGVDSNEDSAGPSPAFTLDELAEYRHNRRRRGNGKRKVGT